MALDCCDNCIQQIKSTSDHCDSLASQLLEEQTRSAQLGEDVTRLNKLLINNDFDLKSCYGAYDKVQNDLQIKVSQSETLKLDHQRVVRECKSLEVNLMNSVDESERIKSKYQAVVERNRLLEATLAHLVDQLYEKNTNHLTRQCCIPEAIAVERALSIDIEDENHVLLPVTDAQSQHSHSTAQGNDNDSINSLDADNSSKRLDEELHDTIARDQAYERQDETLRERENRCAVQEQTLAEQEKRCNNCKQSLMEREERCNEREQSLMKREESCRRQDRILREQAKGSDDKKDDIIKHDSDPQLNPLEKRKINSSISPVPKKQRRSTKRRCTSWQIKAAEYLQEELISAWLLSPWSFWSPGEGSYRNCIRATLINHGLKDPPLERMRLMIAHLWSVWEENRRAELDKIKAKSFGIGSQVKRTLDRVGLRYTLHMSFAPQGRWRQLDKQDFREIEEALGSKSNKVLDECHKLVETLMSRDLTLR